MPTDSTPVWFESNTLIGGTGNCSAQVLLAKPTKMARAGRWMWNHGQTLEQSKGWSVDLLQAQAIQRIRSSDVNNYPALDE